MNKEKVIIFGTGKSGLRTYHILKQNSNYCDIVGFWDNNSEKNGTFLYEIPVTLPQHNIENIDKILICSVYYKEIHQQLTEQMDISSSIIENEFYFERREMIHYYSYMEEKNDEIKDCIDYLANHVLDVFNDDFRDKYQTLDTDVYFDEEAKMFYLIENKRRMYFKKNMTKNEILNYYKSISMEQDIKSPHRYLVNNWEVQNRDIVIDAGVAEGNFALSIIDKVEKIYLIEADLDWIEALKMTFRNMEDKVVIIPKFLNNFSNQDNITIDEIVKNGRINYIKLDIEGAEEKAIFGGEQAIRSAENLKLAVCVYHNQEDEEKISDLLHEYGVKTEPSKGYMFFPNKEDGPLCSRTLQLRRALVRGKKNEKES